LHWSSAAWAGITPTNHINILKVEVPYRGFYPFFSASRTEKMFKAGANWQATEKFSVAMNGRYTDDVYDVTYGVQNGSKWSAGLDASYNYSENGAMSAYMTQQHRQRDLTDLQRAPTLATSPATVNAIAIPAGATWTDKLRDDDFTLGLGVKQNGLMGGKLELLGDVSYSLANTGYGTQLNYSTTTTGGLTCSAPQILSCGDLPDIKTTVIQLKLVGNYTIDKSAKVSLGYLYQYMESADYYYNALQYGYTPNALMPTNQQSPNYSVNVVAASYSYLFR
jgi:MtrB/PioB family decaheme-associated outer membrane protein